MDDVLISAAAQRITVLHNSGPEKLHKINRKILTCFSVPNCNGMGGGGGVRFYFLENVSTLFILL